MAGVLENRCGSFSFLFPLAILGRQTFSATVTIRPAARAAQTAASDHHPYSHGKHDEGNQNEGQNDGHHGKSLLVGSVAR